MTNNEIIINQAIAHGIYTKAEAQAIVAAKGCLPIHTFAEWKKAGYSVKRGEHAAITCDLWKYTERPGKAAKAARAEAAKAGQNSPGAPPPTRIITWPRRTCSPAIRSSPPGRTTPPRPRPRRRSPPITKSWPTNARPARQRSRPPQLPPLHSPPPNVSKFPCSNPHNPQGRRTTRRRCKPGHPARGGRSWVHKTAHTKRNTKQEAAHYDHLHAFPFV